METFKNLNEIGRVDLGRSGLHLGTFVFFIEREITWHNFTEPDDSANVADQSQNLKFCPFSYPWENSVFSIKPSLALLSGTVQSQPREQRPTMVDQDQIHRLTSFKL